MLLGELMGLGIDPSPFSGRMAALEAEPPARRALVADSLLIDLTARIKDGRERRRLERDLADRLAELSEMKSSGSSELRAKIERALGTPALNAPELLKRADFLIEAEVRAIAADSEGEPCWKVSQVSVTRSRKG